MKASLKLRWSYFNSSHFSLCFNCVFFHVLRRKTGVFTQTCHCKLKKIFKHPYYQCALTCWLHKKKKSPGLSDGVFSCTGQMKVIHVAMHGTPRPDDTTDLNCSSVQYHSVKQDIRAISYLRKS